MKILSIETSCDDTGIAVLDTKENKNSPEFSVLSNVIASQVEMGKKYGGVYPAMAKREHQKNLVPVFVTALKHAGLLKSLKNNLSKEKFEKLKEILEREPELYKKLILYLKKYTKPDIDLISVTNGPGLEPCLWVGINFAKALSFAWDIPVVPVNHIESHILVNTLENKNIKFPAIALVVSGGHTQLILVKKFGDYKILGETRDDAAGECFDKCAKILGLGYPGGPIIAKLAEKNRGRASIQLPRPMINTKDYDFSFSGLKTAVLYAWQKSNKKPDSNFFVSRRKSYKFKKLQKEFAAEIQQAVIDVLIKKTIKALKDFGAKSLILGGGVSANQELRKQFEKVMNDEAVRFLSRDKKRTINFLVPQANLSTDNGLMIAVAGYFKQKKTVVWSDIQANGNMRIGE